MADEISSLSPYTYANNNPVLLNDPLGLFADWEEFNRVVDRLLEQENGGWSEATGFMYFDEATASAVSSYYGQAWGSPGDAVILPEVTVTADPIVDDWDPFGYLKEAQQGGVESDGCPPGAPCDQNKVQLLQAGLDGGEHLAGPGLMLLTSPLPKRFVAPNSSTMSSVLSATMRKAIPAKININGATRLYTHTVNGSARYASTWGSFLGRWGTKILGPIGVGLTIYDGVSFLGPYWSGVELCKTIKRITRLLKRIN